MFEKFDLKASASIISIIALATACSQHASETIETATTEATISDSAVKKVGSNNPSQRGTAKPGVSVNFTHQFRTTPATNQYGVVEVDVSQRYQSGTLYLTAISGSENIEITSAGSTMQINMEDTDSKIWDISFKPTADGVHFINISATAKWDDAPDAIRTYSIRVETGDSQSLPPSKTETLSTGESAVMMEAEETIEN